MVGRLFSIQDGNELSRSISLYGYLCNDCISNYLSNGEAMALLEAGPGP